MDLNNRQMRKILHPSTGLTIARDHRPKASLRPEAVNELPN